MAKSNKALKDEMRNTYLEQVAEMFKGNEEEVLRTASNEICIPCVDKGGNESYLVIKFSIPSGSRDGDLYDGYAMAEEYEMKCKANEEKAKAKAKAKAEKLVKEEKAKASRHKAKSKGA